MPLHLLGKKSWNVYNPESIARVRKDEAAARAREAEREHKLRDADAAQRLELLRTGTTENVSQAERTSAHSRSPDRASHRKRRKLRGENDTDWELRLAHEEAVKNSNHAHSDAGFTSEATKRTQSSRMPALEQGMRFVDAADSTKRGSGNPWYSSIGPLQTDQVGLVSLDRWGNDDPRRQQREQQRLTANDPLLMMRKGVKQVKENEKQRKDWMAQRERDLGEVEELARRRHRKRRRQRDSNDMENFSLDSPADMDAPRHSRRRKHDQNDPHHHQRSRRKRHSHSRSPTKAPSQHHSDDN